MNKKLLFLFLWLAAWSIGPLHAQTLSWQEINYANPEPVDQSLGNSGGVIVDAKPDGAGNLIMVGYYSNIVDFPKVGGGNIRLVSDLYSTMFIGKWSTSSRAWVWISSTKGASGNALALNGRDIYVTGNYGSTNVTIAGTRLPDKGTNDSDVFVAKYTDNGSSVSDGWAISFGSNGPGTDDGRAIAVSGNNLYVAGAIYGTATIAGTSFTSAGQGDMFVAKYDLSTSPATGRWAVSGGDVRQDQANALAISGNSVYVGGSFAKNLVLSGTTLTTDVIQNRDLFLAKLIDNGNSVGNGWAISDGKNMGSRGETLDNMRLVGSDLYVTGFYAGAGATIANVPLSSPFASLNMYVAKYTDAGSSATPRWATGITNATSYNQGNDVEVIGNNVYVTGNFFGTATIAGTSFTSSGTIGGDSFVAAYTDTGDSVSDKGAIVGGSPEDVDQAYVFSLSGGSLYALGYVRNGAVFGGNTVQSTGRSVIPFIAKVGTYPVTNLAPTVTTSPASAIATNSATLGGNVTTSGGATVTSRGVVYSSTNTTPTVGGNGVTTAPNGTGTGPFSAVISGLTAGTTYSVRAYATNSVGTSYGSTQTFATSVPTITVAPPTLPNGTVGVAYSQVITGSGGTAPYTLALTAGTLPPGMTLSSGGVLSGTPTGGGTYAFTIRATDASTTGSGPYSGSRSYAFTIAAPTITLGPATLLTGTIGAAYTQTITASGGTSPYTYAVTAGALPSGLTLSSTGVLSGTPTDGSTSTFTIAATDASTGTGPYAGSRSYTLAIVPPTITGLAVTPATVCTGGAVTVTATIGQTAGTYSYTLIYGGQTILGTTTTAVSRTLTAGGSGSQTITLRAGTGAAYNTATTTLTVNPLPVVSITNLAAAYCQDAASFTLTGSPAGAAGSFTIDGSSGVEFIPMSLTVGQHTVGYRYTDGNGCSNSTSQTVTIKATPPAPRLLTQTGQSYPGSQSAVTVDLNTGNVTLVASGCAGTVNWTGSNNTAGTGTSIIVPTTQAGAFTYQASCTIDGCASPLATARVTVGGRLTLLHQDVDNYADNNAIQPLLQIQNQGAGPLPLAKLTLRYYVTVEGGGTLGNLSVNYAQVGNQNVRLRYVALNPAQQGATGYVEYSFADGAGSLAAGANSGSIQGYFTKSDYGSLFEPDDYSYNPVRNQLTGNLRITAYYDGVLIAGLEPGSTTQIRAVRALTESKNGPDATQISTYLEVRNEGNVAINYSDLKARYYFTADGPERLQVEVDEGNVSTQLVKLPQVVNGADTYLELTFNQGGQLAPGASTGRLRYRISKPDGGRFNQANDYSYQEQPQDRAQNNRVVVLAGSEVVWGTLPSGASARVATSVEPGLGFSVKVLGNPVENEQLQVEITGVQGQPLRLSVSDLSGRLVVERRLEAAGAVERQSLNVGPSAAGLLLLQISTPGQTQTVKVLKAN